MTQQIIGATRKAQRTAGAKINANFDELYDLNTVIEIDDAAAAGSFTVPANYAIVGIYAKNSTANAVTGGLKFGTAAGGAQVVTALAVGANATVATTDANLALRIWGANQTVYYDAVTAWNSAVVDLTIVLRKVF